MQITSAYLYALLFALPALAASAEHGRATDRPLELILLRDNEGICNVLTLRDTQKVRGLQAGSVHTNRLQTHAQPQSGEERVSLVSYDERALWAAAQAECSNTVIPEHAGQVLQQDALTAPHATYSDSFGGSAPPLQIEPLIQSGDSSNRVDLVFFADGYTADEHAKFIADALRLAEDVSYNQTFNTVKPLLNFWAAFTPSKESGIGVGGKPKDTAFGLYRDGTELRGVYYSKPKVARAACLSLGDACDYPILLGNDPLYGGLGGEFTVITPSPANGPLVLRHELGHSVINVGEEYDGGFAYFGVDAAQNLSTPVPWAHWLTPSVTDNADQVVRSERAVMPLQNYAWTMLNASTPWATTFNASGRYARHLVRFSLSGLPAAADLSVRLDGEDLGWAPRKDIGVDRWHYDVHRDDGLKDGLHEVSFTLKNKEREGIAQMCSVEILEFGDESQFNATPGHYSMYPTFSLKNETTYRPTNEDCLMRQVTTPNFCSVCVEGLWLSLLRRVDLIDELNTACTPRRGSPKVNLTANLALVPLAQFRAGAGDSDVAPQESYAIRWTKDGVPLHHFTNQTRLAINGEDTGAVYAVDVTFATEEVHVDKEGLLTAHRDIVLSKIC
ncbi:IgA peptidase M64-domain-containing protein [Phanerochaete sordida]|uniref:IgA peptidase M64-domain-containing protein n=1 Tax=Phanerochaete sordida TaxID=48140 RepID=A0A9P3GDQ8_9APHY|nr:IgA peptidase M64-domain-containing protein [Phanerochaete sordida]